MTNSIASIKSRLTNIAQREKQTYQLILIRYFTERLIYRLSISPFKKHFCLKGGALLYAFEKNPIVFTQDFAESPKRHVQWHIFLQKMNKHVTFETIDFKIIMAVIVEKLQPIYDKFSV